MNNMYYDNMSSNRPQLDRIEKQVGELTVLFLSINRRLNAVQELYEMFTGKRVGNDEE